MTSSYQKRIEENKMLQKRNKELEEELKRMREAINILNSCIRKIHVVKNGNDDDLRIQYKELCEEMNQNDKNR